MYMMFSWTLAQVSPVLFSLNCFDVLPYWWGELSLEVSFFLAITRGLGMLGRG